MVLNKFLPFAAVARGCILTLLLFAFSLSLVLGIYFENILLSDGHFFHLVRGWWATDAVSGQMTWSVALVAQLEISIDGF